jgi:16S rRNA (guanine527-N7)-methyltransferase
LNNQIKTFEDYLAEGAGDLGITLTVAEIAVFDRYYRYLMEENSKYNLTAIQGDKEVAVKHFLDSLTLLKMIDITEGYVVDLGAGAGLPGIPLKICLPGIRLLLLDSVKKKVDFLSAAAELLGLKGVETLWERAENVGKDRQYRERADLVISRAVAPLNVLAELSLPLVRRGGAFIAMKGPGLETELAVAKNAIALMGGAVERIESFTLPIIPDQRTMVLIRKIGSTPAAYPRKAGTPGRTPIL